MHTAQSVKDHPISRETDPINYTFELDLNLTTNNN